MGWTFNRSVNGFTTKVPISKRSISREFSFRFGDTVTHLGTLSLDLIELEKAGQVKVVSPGYYRIRVWHDGRRFYISPTRESGPKLFLGIEFTA